MHVQPDLVIWDVWIIQGLFQMLFTRHLYAEKGLKHYLAKNSV